MASLSSRIGGPPSSPIAVPSRRPVSKDLGSSSSSLPNTLPWGSPQDTRPSPSVSHLLAPSPREPAAGPFAPPPCMPAIPEAYESPTEHMRLVVGPDSNKRAEVLDKMTRHGATLVGQEYIGGCQSVLTFSRPLQIPPGMHREQCRTSRNASTTSWPHVAKAMNSEGWSFDGKVNQVGESCTLSFSRTELQSDRDGGWR